MNWLFFALAGSIAQLIDGALGMGFGLTSSTLLQRWPQEFRTGTERMLITRS